MLMSRTMGTAGKGLPHAGSPREIVELVTNLWDIECRHQLGEISRGDYLQAIAAARLGKRLGEDNGDEVGE